MFWNNVLLNSHIAKVFLTIHGIHYVMDHGFENPLRNMIEISLPKLKLILRNIET
jgi:hypothetical protein